MNIYSFKSLFESVCDLKPSVAAIETVWEYYKSTLYEILEQESCEEFSFSAGVVQGFDGIKDYRHENQLEIYFGRLIDAEKGCSWRTAEINVYFRYEVDEVLQNLLTQLQDFNIEGVYCNEHGKEAHRQKLEGFISLVDGQHHLWKSIRGRKPVQQDIQFAIR